ncbi:hypothetical protein HYH03_009695 [Edaphochlamys debaryana]|uniref:t-SNARE coiled-coil homology domain-containing protein n=1 Tax=Edaphochlamys debaryana TaxID=47281 RepID=A0A836BY77_9CHLO|nr:hypothetical protein HYH03_009695 [Edaphochlamys debaryana]|eukprot:KAG2491964.1 hypothetical protein HYH03_009695 [Edaphochlamys debaryana]
MAPKKAPAPEPDAEAPAAKEEIRFEQTEQEEQCQRIYKELDKAFKQLHKEKNPDKLHAKVKNITNKLKQAKELIKDFEREARADGVPANELAQRKKLLAAELNGFIAMKKEFAQAEGGRGDLLSGAGGEIEMGVEGMSMQQLMTKGRKDIGETDKTLDRAERLVEDTKDVGKNVASTLHDQTQKLEKIMDELNEIEFTMKKATAVIRDITRGLLTDKCIAFLLLLVVCGVVAIIVVKIINPKKVKEGAQAIISDSVKLCQANPQCNATLYDAQGRINQTVADTFNKVGAATGFGPTSAPIPSPVAVSTPSPSVAATTPTTTDTTTAARRALLGRVLYHLLEFNATLT